MNPTLETTGLSPGIWMNFTRLKSAMNTPIAHTDLTQRPPRSMRSRLGGFVLLPRILDKGRAKLVGKNGEYNYNSPTDQHLVRFLGLDLEALLGIRFGGTPRRRSRLRSGLAHNGCKFDKIIRASILFCGKAIPSRRDPQQGHGGHAPAGLQRDQRPGHCSRRGRSPGIVHQPFRLKGDVRPGGAGPVLRPRLQDDPRNAGQ